MQPNQPQRRAGPDPAAVLHKLHDPQISGWMEEAKRFLRPRNAILAGILLTYIWRFHDLAPQLRSLRMAAFATVGSWAFLVLAPRLPVLGKVLRYPYVWLYLVWTVWMGLLVPNALNPDWAWTVWFEAHLKTVTMLLFLLGTITSFALVRSSMAIHVLGAWVMAFFYIKGGFSQDVTPVPGYDRNDLALALNFSLPFALFLAMQAEAKWERILLWGISLAIATSVLMSQSRGGFVTLALVILFMMVRVERISLRARVIPVVLLLGSFFFLPQHIKDRLGTMLNPSEDYNLTAETGRIQVWKRGIGYFKDHPVAGVGISNFPVAELTLSEQAQRGGRATRVVTHNSYLEVAVESGLPGLLMYLGMFFSVGFSTVRLRGRLNRIRGSPQAERLVLLADFLTLSLIGYAFGSFFLSMAYSPMLPAFLALAAGFRYTVERWMRQVGAATRAVQVSRARGVDRFAGDSVEV